MSIEMEFRSVELSKLLAATMSKDWMGVSRVEYGDVTFVLFFARSVPWNCVD